MSFFIVRLACRKDRKPRKPAPIAVLFCSFLRLAAKNNSHHFHKEDSFFSVGPSFFLITGEPEAGGPGGGSWAYHILQMYTGKFLSEALIFAAAKSQYDKRLFTELRVQ